MTEPIDHAGAGAPLREVAELVARVAENLQAGDDAAVRAQAAADIERLQTFIAQVEQTAQAGLPGFDLAQIGEAIRLLAEWLRAPTAASEASAQRGFAELQATLGPLLGWEPARDAAARRAHFRQEARTSMDNYFRDHPIKPMKP
jgi:hypothetical protein